MRRDPNCQLCRLHKTANTVCLLGDGASPADIMVISEKPKDREDKLGRHVYGEQDKLLDQLMDTAGIPTDVYFCTSVACRPPEDRGPTKGEVKNCKKWVDYQMAMVKPKFVLLLGAVPLLTITGKPGISKARGRPFEQDGVIYLPTLSLGTIYHDPEAQRLIEIDLKLFSDIIREGQIPRENKLKITVVRTWRQFDGLIRALRNTVSFDIETNSLYPWQTHNDKGQPEKAIITTIGFGTADGEFSIPINHPDSPWNAEAIGIMMERLDAAVSKCSLIMHNGKFDCLWMLVHFGVHWYEYLEFDTMLAHYILDENDRHGLKYLAMKFLGAPDWDIDAQSKKGHTSFDKLALYHAHDLYYTRQLKFLFAKMLREDPQTKAVFNKILMPCARLFTEIEFDGCYIQIEKFDEAEKYLRDQFHTAEKELQKYGDINWGSTQQLAKLLFGPKSEGGLGIAVVEKTKAGNASCNESVLKRIDHECVGALLKFREAKQQLSFFIDGWKPFLHKRRIQGEWHYFLHPSFKLHGTATGRLSCEHPNLQQVPRDPRVRSLISAPPGWTLVEWDLSQIELRIAAELAGERNMLHAFINGIDVHWLTALREIERGAGYKDLVLDTARTWKQDKKIGYSDAIQILLEMGPDNAAEINAEWKELRKKAKAINFGYLFGMWWKKFKIYARDNYGVTITDQQAEASRKFFFGEYRDLDPWHKRQKSFARRNGYVRSLSGRKRRLPKAMHFDDTPERQQAERQAINSPVQSFANELNLMSLIQLRQEYGRDVVRPCGTVHDAILAWVRNDKVEEVFNRQLEIMSWPSLMDEFDIKLKVPIEAEGKIGPWGQGVSLKKWKEKQHVHS